MRLGILIVWFVASFWSLVGFRLYSDFRARFQTYFQKLVNLWKNLNVTQHEKFFNFLERKSNRPFLIDLRWLQGQNWFKLLKVKHITTLTAMEISFWRLTGQTIIMVPICHYRFNLFISNFGPKKFNFLISQLRYHKRLPNSDIFNQIPLLLLYAAVCCTTVVTGFKSFVLLPIGSVHSTIWLVEKTDLDRIWSIEP